MSRASTAPPVAKTPARKAAGAAKATDINDAAAKNRPLMEDIRLLGRLLGDVIREQEGKEAFELIERVRQLSVAYRLKKDASAGRVLDRLLKNLSADQTVSVIRAFSYFSHLANIAEDRHHVRRRQHHERQGHRQDGSLALCFERLHRADVRSADVVAMLTQAYISPVLTAHPTEVQRKSILDAERAIAELIGQRDDLGLGACRAWGVASEKRPQREQFLPDLQAHSSTLGQKAGKKWTAEAVSQPTIPTSDRLLERDRRDNEVLMRARITQLWQTRMLRYTKLTVADDVILINNLIF